MTHHTINQIRMKPDGTLRSVCASYYLDFGLQLKRKINAFFKLGVFLKKLYWLKDH